MTIQKLQINKNNFYYIQNSKNYIDLFNLVKKHPTSYFRTLKSNGRKRENKTPKYKYLLDWIYSQTANIKDDININLRCYIILMGLKEIPKCKMCGGNIIVEVVRQNKEYPIYCSLYCSNKSVEHKENRERTNIKKYGFKSCLQNNSIRNKIQQTMLQRYGVKYTGQSQQLMEKVEKTNLKKYGCRSCLGSKSIRNKIEKTMIMKYGCKNPMQHTVIQNNVKRKYIYNNIYFDSQVEIATYIYFRENNISFEYHPNVSFEYFYSGKRHLYFPDFVVNGEYVEIKGSQFFENKDETKRMICPYNRRKDDLFEEKHKCMILNKVKIITEKKYVVFLKYVHKKYGKKYLRQFKI